MRTVIIYKDQTSVRLILETGVDFQANPLTAQGAKVAYRKPDASENVWQGTILNPPGNDGDIYFDFSSSDKFDAIGDWVVWAELTFSDGRVGYGRPKFYNVIAKGTTSN